MSPIGEECHVSVSVCTYNRCGLLRHALDSLLAQRADGVPYELLVVDNNSTDDTKRLVNSYIARGHQNLRYLFECRQGLSYARETAVSHARAPIVAFTDDDIRVAPDWVATIKRAMDRHPEVDCVGGKVLPHWTCPRPSWLTPEHWAPLAILDYGDRPFHVNAAHQRCLVAANLAIRKDVLNRLGGFEPTLQRVKDSIGSMEDHELFIRLWNDNRQGLYAPELVVTSAIPAQRLAKAYHRRWHRGHGGFSSMARLEELERSNTGRLLGVPAHMYRQAALDVHGWVRCALRGDFDRAFVYEARLMFFWGFFRNRSTDRADARGPGEARREFRTFLKSVARWIAGRPPSRRHGASERGPTPH